MAVATALALAWFAWDRLKPLPGREPPKVGESPPPLRLVDPETDEPLILFGLRGKVVWLTFWSAEAATSRGLLDELAKAEKRLHARGHFSMIAVAVDRHDPAKLRAAKGAVPVYLATPETLRSYGVASARLPLHILIDDDGHVGVIAQGADPETVSRLARQAELWLDAIEPFGGAHFAGLGVRHRVKSPEL